VTTVLLFHHALGQTPGFLAFADELRNAGHTVHTPDLYEGRVFDDLDRGVDNARKVGFGEIIRRGVAAADELPTDVVYAGFSLGVMPAQALAQGRPGARGALFYLGTLPPSEFDSPWPAGLPVQVHMKEHDPWAEEDMPAAKALMEEADDGELFIYPGRGHLFADPSHQDYDEPAARLLMERTLALLSRVG
jgi:dienelactone hydrolase